MAVMLRAPGAPRIGRSRSGPANAPHSGMALLANVRQETSPHFLTPKESPPRPRPPPAQRVGKGNLHRRQGHERDNSPQPCSDRAPLARVAGCAPRRRRGAAGGKPAVCAWGQRPPGNRALCARLADVARSLCLTNWCLRGARSSSQFHLALDDQVLWQRRLARCVALSSTGLRNLFLNAARPGAIFPPAPERERERAVASAGRASRP
jgi:hypothetical protein